MTIGMNVNAPFRPCTIRRVTGCDPLPYKRPMIQREPMELATPMLSSTKNAGLRNTNAMSKRVSRHSCAQRVARSERGAGNGVLAAAAAAGGSTFPAFARAPRLAPTGALRATKRKRR